MPGVQLLLMVEEALEEVVEPSIASSAGGLDHVHIDPRTVGTEIGIPQDQLQVEVLVPPKGEGGFG